MPLVELLRLRRDDRLGPLGLAAAARERLGDDLPRGRRCRRGSSRRARGSRDRGRAGPRGRRAGAAGRAAVAAPAATVAASSTGPARSSRRSRRRRVASSSSIRSRSVLLFATSAISAPRLRRLRAACSLTLPAPSEEDRAAFEAAEDLLRERGGGRRHRRGALADRGLRPHLAARVQRLPEDAVEHRPGRPELVREPHLAEDLALARNERVEPGGDAEEVVRGGLGPAAGRAPARPPARATRGRRPHPARPAPRRRRRGRARCGCRSRGRRPRAPPPRAARPAPAPPRASSATCSRSSTGAW